MTGWTPGRRGFLAGMLATGLAPRATWADAGAPAFLGAAADAAGGYALCGIGSALDIAFRIPLPGRGHAAATHPDRPLAVAFARRPGAFALVIDCAAGREVARLSAPEGRHFYGHGAFSSDGRWLYTTENVYDAGRGQIGVWDAEGGFARADEFDSGGVGPHDIRRLPGRETLVVANGGIETHPASGRAKLNIPFMRPNLSYIEDGQVIETIEPAPEHHKNSIRHLAVAGDGRVAFGAQWQGAAAQAPLVGFHTRGQAIEMAEPPADALRAMRDYVGSIAFSPDGAQVVATSPRGGVVQVYDARARRLSGALPLRDVSGVAASGGALVVSSGTGLLRRLDDGAERAAEGLRWDNHLVAL
ncbi:DUF1513 domain-containing protein [Roseovarius spongiae]|uniref:DUF1513 domain-containing protein n=1 Tax=Roseovarius spongiae TaxID=2320272 RepID=A0A3A8ARX7_9RHOB|nr:DUF1513 domain-containing protein [Roseovarius spongiae]RKF13797.1 DUF1513 domain-containing protein [Roseovarius spongiae]